MGAVRRLVVASARVLVTGELQLMTLVHIHPRNWSARPPVLGT